MAGNITRRGKSSWRLKFKGAERDPDTGRRSTRFVTFRGTKRDAVAELTRLLGEVAAGTAVNPTKMTVGEYVREWLRGATHLSRKTLERYRELAEHQILPHLGPLPLQKLRPAHIADWHATILRAGGRNGRPLAARTVGHAHRVLHAALAHAARLKRVSRNVAGVVAPPKPEVRENEILSAAQVADVLAALVGHWMQPIVVTALGTGMRRGELCALRWQHVDLVAAVARVEGSLEETGGGLRMKGPKSRHGRRRISLPRTVVDVLRAHGLRQNELRLALGVGRAGPEDLIFCKPDGSPLSPDRLSRQWRDVVTGKHLPRVSFHALRHTHASALIAAGVDVVTVSRRLGHGSPGITLGVYAHLFSNTDAAAAQAMDAALANG